MMTESKKQRQTPGVVFQPRVSHGFQRGINQLVKAISPTLGPFPRLVVNENLAQKDGPELLDNGAIIARRIIMLPNRSEDAGAMYLRQMLWQMHELAGDGTATAAVLFQSLYNQGMRYITAGGNAMTLRRHLEQAAQIIDTELSGMTTPLQGSEQLAGLAETLCGDPSLAEMLGQIFATIGEHGRLEIRSGRSRELELEFIEGSYWDGGFLSPALANHPSGKAFLEDASVLITDLAVQKPQELVPLIDMALRAGIRSLLLVVSSMSEQALSVLLMPANRTRIQVVVVKTSSMTMPTHQEDLVDIALLTGGRVLLEQAGDTLEAVTLDDLGQVRRAWADQYYFGLVEGQGDSGQVQQRITELQFVFKRTQEVSARKRLQDRLSKLVGGAAVLWVGGLSPLVVEARKELAKQTAEAMRGALREGVVPGGGVALLKCKPALQEKKRQAQNADERAAYNILLQAIEVPIRTLLSNAGYSPEDVLAQIVPNGSEYGFDVTRGEVVEVSRAGIFDIAPVVKAAISTAIHGAALALTIDVLVHRAHPPVEPNI